MAQLRQDYERLAARDVVVIVVGPEKREAFAAYWQAEALPFVGVPDALHQVARLYHQQVKLQKFGRMPAMMVIDKGGRVRFQHHGHDMTDIPSTDDVLAVLDTLDAEGRRAPPNGRPGGPPHGC